MLKVRVPASTSNLGSGFDCFGLALKLYLEIEVEAGSEDLQISVSGEGANEIPTDAQNLVYRAFLRFHQAIDQKPRSLRIKIRNEIPLFRGLGSSGAAAVAGLVLAAKQTKTTLSDAEIIALANEIEGHPENASASLLGGLTINCQDSGGIVSRKVEVRDDLRAVLLIPEARISTLEARNVLPKKVPHSDAVFNLQRSALLAHIFLSGDYELLRLATQDRLHQSFRQHLIPGYEEFERNGYEKGALGVCISGSGSAILGLTLKNAATTLSLAWSQLTDEMGLAATVGVLEIENEGVRKSWEDAA